MTITKAVSRPSSAVARLYASALISLLAATAHAQAPRPEVRFPTPSDIQVMTAMKGEYRTILGSVVDGELDAGGGFTALGVRPGPEDVRENFIIQPYDTSKFAGNLGLSRRGTGLGGGALLVTRTNGGALLGSYHDRSKTPNPVEYAACPLKPGEPSDAKFSQSPLWVSLGSRQHKPDGTYVVQVSIQNVSTHDEVIGGGDHLWLAGSSGEVPSSDPRNPADGRHYRGGETNLKPCQWVTVAYTFDRLPSAPRDLFFQPGYGKRVKWDVAIDFTPQRPEPTPAPQPQPQPGPATTPIPRPQPAPVGVGPSVGGAFGAAQTYGPWSFQIDELVRGPDGNYQAVLTVRNASQQRLGFTITDLDASLIDADGRTVRRLGNLYLASSTGPVSALERNAATNYLEPGDQLRARLLFQVTAAFKPVQIRLKEPVRSGAARTFPVR